MNRTRSRSSACGWPAALVARPASAGDPSATSHVWDVQEITFSASRDYANPYADVVIWVELEGPGFTRRVYGFWDGGRTFKVRVAATAPGEWRWTSGSNQPDDAGLNGKRGTFLALAWSEAEKRANANRRGVLRPTSNGRALEYADGTPFFLLGDTWLAASTWRLPFKGVRPSPDYVPGPGISFEEAVAFRKRQGFNSVSFIAAFPNWAADQRASTFADAKGVFLRNAWEKFGHWSDGRPPDGQGHGRRAGPPPLRSLRRPRRAWPISTASIPPTSRASTASSASWPSRDSSRCSSRCVATAVRRGRPTSTSTLPTGASCSTSCRATAPSTSSSAASTSTGSPRSTA